MAASTLHLWFSSLAFACLLVSSCFFQLCSCVNNNPKQLNLSTTAVRWYSAGATWYGSPNGAGSDGGACGYGNAVSLPPFSSMITATGPSLYKSGTKCGACFKVKCTEHPACSGVPVRVVITDSCPGGPCASDTAHFDLSGTAFGAMAKAGQRDKLRNAGVLKIRFARIACDYSGKTIAFHVDLGSNTNYIAMVVEFMEGDGDLAGVALKDGSNKWRAMRQSWGAVWKLDPGTKLQPPFSIQLTSQNSKQTVVAKNVIPPGWKPGATYRSLVNYL